MAWHCWRCNIANPRMILCGPLMAARQHWNDVRSSGLKDTLIVGRTANRVVDQDLVAPGKRGSNPAGDRLVRDS
jgi:hypothetical protein